MKNIVRILIAMNIMVLIYIFLPLIFVTRFEEVIQLLWYNNIGFIIYIVLATPTAIFWLYCLIDSIKKKKSAYHIILLLILHVFYLPFYAYKTFLTK